MTSKLCLSLVAATLLAFCAACGGGGGGGFVNDGTAASMLARINADRTASGLTTLGSNATLQTVAQNQATYMASIDQLSPTNAAGDTILEQVEDAGVLAATAQLTASGLTEAETFGRLVNSPALRAVFSGVNMTDAGIGYAVSGDLQYWCIITAEMP
jgi:uncharacterized protein YkwD